jgi:hypothetical protein
MSSFVVLLLVLGAGLLVGSRLNSASEAHTYFSMSRGRVAKSFSLWMRQLVRAVIGVFGLVVLLWIMFESNVM